MLTKYKNLAKRCFATFGYEITSSAVNQKSDNPLEILERLFSKDKVYHIVDGGASIGEISIEFATKFPNAKVSAFEPYPKYFDFLLKKCKEYPNITPLNIALSNFSGETLLSVTKSEDTSSLLDPESKESTIYGKLLEQKDKIPVKVTTLDEYFSGQAVDIIKLDLQGGEFDALRGSEGILKEGRTKAILCEVMFEKQYKNQRNWTDLVQLIESSGFELFNIYQTNFDQGKILQADLLFLNNNDKIFQPNRSKFHNFSKLIIDY